MQGMMYTSFPLFVFFADKILKYHRMILRFNLYSNEH